MARRPPQRAPHCTMAVADDQEAPPPADDDRDYARLRCVLGHGHRIATPCPVDAAATARSGTAALLHGPDYRYRRARQRGRTATGHTRSAIAAAGWRMAAMDRQVCGGVRAGASAWGCDAGGVDRAGVAATARRSDADR